MHCLHKVYLLTLDYFRIFFTVLVLLFRQFIVEILDVIIEWMGKMCTENALFHILVRRSVFIGNEVLSSCNEVIKHILFVSKCPSLVPLVTILSIKQEQKSNVFFCSLHNYYIFEALCS